MTAALTLSLPIAVRRVVDNFFAESLALVDAYFAAALGIAALLALGTAARFYLVTRLGERVVADIRRAIYDRVIGMSPGFYERIMTGEVLSRLTTDTTLVLSVIGSSVSVALRNVLTLIGGLVLLFVTSPKLTGLVLVGRAAGAGADPGARAAAARAVAARARTGSPRRARRPRRACSRRRRCRPTPTRRRAAPRSPALVERSFDAARRRIRTRAALTAIVIFLVFASIVAVLWIGARDVRAGAMTPGRAGAVRDLRGDRRGLGGGALRRSGASCSGRRARPSGWSS